MGLIQKGRCINMSIFRGITGDEFDVATSGGISGTLTQTEQAGVYIGNVDGSGELDVLITQDASSAVTIDQAFVDQYLGGTLGSVILDQDGNSEHSAVNISADLTGNVTIDNDTEWDGSSSDAIARANLNISGQDGAVNIEYAMDVNAHGFDQDNLTTQSFDIRGRHWVYIRDGYYNDGEAVYSVSQTALQNVGANLNVTVSGENEVNVSGHVTTNLTTDEDGHGGVALQQSNLVNFNHVNHDGSSVTDTATYTNTFDIVNTDDAKYDAIFGEGNWIRDEDLSTEAKAAFDAVRSDHWQTGSTASSSVRAELNRYSHVIVEAEDGSAHAYSHWDNYGLDIASDDVVSRTDPLNSVNYLGTGSVDISGASQVDEGVVETDSAEQFVSRNEFTGNVTGNATQTSDVTVIGSSAGTTLHSTSGNYVADATNSSASATASVDSYNTRDDYDSAQALEEVSRQLSALQVMKDGGLINKISGSDSLMYYDIVTSLQDADFASTLSETEHDALTYFSDYANFKPVATNKQWITSDSLNNLLAQ